MTTSLQACHSIYYKYCVYVMFAKGLAPFWRELELVHHRRQLSARKTAGAYT